MKMDKKMLYGLTLVLIAALVLVLCTGCGLVRGTQQDLSKDLTQKLEKLQNEAMLPEETPFMLDGDSFDAVEPEEIVENDVWEEEPQPEETNEPEEQPAAEPEAAEAPMYGLMIDDFEAEPMDYGSEDWGVNSYTRAYLYDGMVKVIVGRVEEVTDDAQAREWIAQRADANETVADTHYSDLYSAGHVAYMMSYTSGGNEDTRKCVDVYLLAEDAMHWFHTATPIDWYEDYSMQIERWIQGLYLEQWN